MTINSCFLDIILEATIKKFNLNSDEFVNYLFQSPVFDNDQRDILLKGIQKYLEQDYIIAVHLLIPQIEKSVRNIVKMLGGADQEKGRNGGWNLINLDKLLQTEQITQSLGEDIPLYFRVVLTDQRGWNMRNNVCHGIYSEQLFSKSWTQRLIHIFLVLAQLRAKNNQPLEEKFKTLSTQVIEDTAGMSSTIEIAKHPAYQEIIKMGEPVIPLLLKDLQQNPLYWLTALQEITQENPVKPEHKGKIKQMAQAWLNWGKEKDYID